MKNEGIDTKGGIDRDDFDGFIGKTGGIIKDPTGVSTQPGGIDKGTTDL